MPRLNLNSMDPESMGMNRTQKIVKKNLAEKPRNKSGSYKSQ